MSADQHAEAVRPWWQMKHHPDDCVCKMCAPTSGEYLRLRKAVEDALIVLDGYSGRVVDTAKTILREALTDGGGA